VSDTAPSQPDRPDDRTALEALVGEWLTLPDVAEALGIEVKKVRGLIAERSLVGIRRGERNIFQVPAAFLVSEEAEDRARHVLATLRGTVLVLGDVGLDDAGILRWLFETEPSIGRPPIEELRAGRRAEVRRVAQALL